MADTAHEPDVGAESALRHVMEGGARREALRPEAERALAEAAARRDEIDRRAAELAETPELNGRGGLDPVRYADWEIGGRAVDF